MIQIDHLKYHNSKINLRFVEFSAIEAQSRKMMCLHNHFNLLVCEVRMERSDRQISNRTMREEFYSNRNITEHCAELKDWNEELEKFIYKYNHYRPHNSLDFKTPYEYYEDIIKKEGIFSQKVVG